MNNRIFGVLGDALKVAGAAWGVLWLEPWTDQAFSNLDKGWRFLISAFIAAIFVELVWQLVLGWPRMEVHWAARGEDVALTEIRAKASKRKPDTQAFHLRISAPSKGWLGHQILRLWMCFGVTLQIRIEQASVVPSVEDSHKVDTRPTTVPDNESKGFGIELGRAPRRPGHWHWADVRWRDESSPPGVSFNVDYVLHHENAFVKFLLCTFVWRSAKARTFQVVGP